MNSSASLGASMALLAALAWGGGDFAGGMGAKAAGGTARGALRLMIAAHGTSLLCLLAVLCLQGSFVWRAAPVAWGLGCGVVAGLSIAAFYVALARGTMGTSAAVSGLLAAAIPAMVGTVLDGRPGAWRLAGFAVAALAIWLIAAPGAEGLREPPQIMALALGGGVGFGLYFAGLRFANGLGVLEPLALARTGSVLTCAVLLWALRSGESRSRYEGTGWLPVRGWWWALGVAVLDSGGNLFYLAATRMGRLDVAAVLAALYPASTILLAAAVLQERPSRRQMAGMGVALLAVVLVTI